MRCVRFPASTTADLDAVNLGVNLGVNHNDDRNVRLDNGISSTGEGDTFAGVFVVGAAADGGAGGAAVGPG